MLVAETVGEGVEVDMMAREVKLMIPLQYISSGIDD